VGQAGTEFIGISSKMVLRPRTRPQSPHRHPANFRLKLDSQANLRYPLELLFPISLGSPMIEATSDDAKINGIARIGSQPIALAAAALVIIVIGAGSIGLWRAYLGSSPEQDRMAAVRLVQARVAQASEQIAERTKGLEASQEESIDQLQAVQDQLQTLRRAVAAQQLDNKRLSEQVGDLSGAIDSLKQSFASAQAPEASSSRSTSTRSRHHVKKAWHHKPAGSRH
jgi:uncharacterized protein HemX